MRRAKELKERATQDERKISSLEIRYLVHATP
jgi:hypothetical protein